MTAQVDKAYKARALFMAFASMGSLPIPSCGRGARLRVGGKPMRASNRHEPIAAPTQEQAEAFCRKDDLARLQDRLRANDVPPAQRRASIQERNARNSRAVIAQRRKEAKRQRRMAEAST